MKHYLISYYGWTTTNIEAENEQEARDKFFEDGLNDLNDAEINEVQEHKHKWLYGKCSDWACHATEPKENDMTELILPDPIAVDSADEARQLAIAWQYWFSENSISYYELQGYNKYFTELANKFNLTAEFSENGII